MSGTVRHGATRRGFLAGGGALALAAGLGIRRVRAADTVALGDGEVTILSDGSLMLPMGFVLPEQAPEDIAALLVPHGLATDGLRPDCNVTLLRRGDSLVLFDAGAGQMFQDTAGKLVDSLAAVGIDPAEISDVVFTHAHPDHIWGVLDEFDEPVFSEARYWVPQAEWDYWRAEETLDAMPEERKSFVVGARTRLDAIEDSVALVRPGDEVLEGIEAVDTGGHTPGHMSYLLHGGGESLLVIGDAISHAVISFERPDWRSGTDQDRERGAATRAKLLDRAAADRLRIVGFHLPYPGVGFVERAGAAYRFAAG